MGSKSSIRLPPPKSPSTTAKAGRHKMASDLCGPPDAALEGREARRWEGWGMGRDGTGDWGCSSHRICSVIRDGASRQSSLSPPLPYATPEWT